MMNGNNIEEVWTAENNGVLENKLEDENDLSCSGTLSSSSSLINGTEEKLLESTNNGATNGEGNSISRGNKRRRESAEVAMRKIRKDLQPNAVEEENSQGHSNSSETSENKESSCEQSECGPEKSCCLELAIRCIDKEKTIGKQNYFHLSKGEHVCQVCFDEICRIGRPYYDRYIVWKNQWINESRCKPNVRLFIQDQLLPFWIDCKKCGKFRKVLLEKAIPASQMAQFECSQVLDEKEVEPCEVLEDECVQLSREKSWIQTVSAPPLLHNSPALHYLRLEYYYDEVGMSTINDDFQLEQACETREYMCPFNIPTEQSMAFCLRPDVMEYDEVQAFPEYTGEPVLYLAMRNLVVALFISRFLRILVALGVLFYLQKPVNWDMLSGLFRCLFNLLILGYLCNGILHIPDVLVNEKNTGQPGVKARLSRKGIQYIGNFLANSLLPELINLKLEITPQKLDVENGEASIVDMDLSLKKSPVAVITDLKAPNIVVVNLQGIDILSKATLSGRIFGRNLSGSAVISSSNLKALISVSVMNNTQGSPNLRIAQCKVRGSIETSFEDVPEQLKRPLQESFKNEGLELLEGFLCSRVEVVLEERINTRFGFMNPKITMASLTKQLDEQTFITDVLTRMRAIRLKKREIIYYETEERMHNRLKRSSMISGFNVSRADSLYLDYTITTIHSTAIGLEIESSGEVSLNGRGGTPFGPVDFKLPNRVNEDSMLQLAISDFMTNSLLYHGHTIGLFDTRVDPTTPKVGSILKTTCSLSTGQLFCLGDMFPTLKKIYPNRFLVLSFSTIQAPVVLFMPQHAGGIGFTLFGKIILSILDENKQNETEVAEMGIDVNAKMQMRLTSTVVKPRLTFNSIKLNTMSPGILLQEELDDAVLLAREVIQRLVNDILRDGIPIPIHPLFKLNKPLVKILNRAILINTNFNLNENLLKQLITADISKTDRA
uniref:Lipid-binding serum glycoprotein C-terminal domain-containing protein n=1 Tax=Acrobeloides nanus TaxID=290746 RepID=A0A914DVB8_9BILA